MRSLPGTAGVALPAAFPDIRVTRDKVKAALERNKYKQIMDIRLAHIPKRLPFAKAGIIDRLRQNDWEGPNRPKTEALLELETDLAFLTGSLDPKEPRGKSSGSAKVRRLERIWDELVLTADRLKLIVAHRDGRLSHNLTLFLQSDLPGGYMAAIGASTHWEIAGVVISFNAEAQRLVHDVLGIPLEEATRPAFLEAVPSSSAIHRAYRTYHTRCARLTALADAVLGWRDALEYYVDLFSARDLAEFRTVRAIRVSSLDRAAIEELVEGLQKATSALRHLLVREYPGGLSSYPWLPSDHPLLSDLLKMELATA